MGERRRDKEMLTEIDHRQQSAPAIDMLDQEWNGCVCTLHSKMSLNVSPLCNGVGVHHHHHQSTLPPKAGTFPNGAQDYVLCEHDLYLI